MDNRKIENIPKKSFDLQEDSVVDLRTKIGASRDEKKDESLDKLIESAQKSELRSNPMKNLKSEAKNRLRVFSPQSSAEKLRRSGENDSDEINNERKDIKSNYFLRYFIYFLVFLLPIFVLPFSVEIFEFNKTLLLFAVSSLAFLIWIAKMIVIDRHLAFVRTPLNIPIVIFIFIILLSTALSVDKISSVLGFYGRFSESLMVYLSLAMLYFVGVNSAVGHSTANRLHSPKGTMEPTGNSNFTNNLIKIFLASSSIVVIVSLFYSLGFKFIPWDETQFRSFNLVAGSLNILGIYLVSVIIIALYYLSENKNAFVKYSVFSLIAASLILLAIIDFIPAWIVLAISLLSALILMFVVQRKSNNTVIARSFSERRSNPAINGDDRDNISDDINNRIASVAPLFRNDRSNFLFVPILIIITSFAFIATSLTFINKDVKSNFESSLISSSIKNRIIPSVDNGQIENGNGFAKEIILDKKIAVSIAIEGIKKDPISGIIGTGPGTYLYSFSKFKPVEFNNSIFWSIRFDKAGSEIIEKISTIGILGVLGYLLIIVLTIGMFLKSIVIARSSAERRSNPDVNLNNCNDTSGDDSSGIASVAPLFRNDSLIYLFSAWLSLLLFQFLYLESTTIKFVFWMLTIILVMQYIIALRLHLTHPDPSQEGNIETHEKNIFWEFKIRKSNYIFCLSLLLVIMAPIVVFYYYQIRSYQAETAYKTAVFAYDKAKKDTGLTKQDAWSVLDQSVEDLKGVIKKDPYNGNYKSFLSDVHFNRLAIVIQEENEKNNEERNNQIIAQEMKGVVDHAKSAADDYPNNIFFQQRLGNVYAFMFSDIKIADADEWAIKKYNKAISLEPSNPILRTEIGKIFALQYAESMTEDRIDGAISEFEKALELKSDYLDAGLQLGLAYEIKGDNEKAISHLSPFLENRTIDINVGFQLGRIYYNSGNIDKAKSIFWEIIRVQPNNSNARYSLGLIYEKEERDEEALREFEAVLLLNPDNQEVVERIDNLKKLIERKNRKPEPVPEPEPVIEEERIEGETEAEAEE